MALHAQIPKPPKDPPPEPVRKPNGEPPEDPLDPPDDRPPPPAPEPPYEIPPEPPPAASGAVLDQTRNNGNGLDYRSPRAFRKRPFYRCQALCRALAHGKANDCGDHTDRNQNPVELHRGCR